MSTQRISHRHSRVSLAALLCASTLVLSACKSELDDKPTAAVKDPAPKKDSGSSEPSADAGKTTTLALDSAGSKIEFVGAKVTDDHRGSFDAPTGEATVGADGSLTALKVEVKTNTVAIEPAQLKTHLMSEDFFDVEKFPTATFALTEATAKAGADGATHEVTGELSLHGVTKQITFPATVKTSRDSVAASAGFKINRKDFGIVYAGMADDLIKDDVLLELDFKFTGATS